MCGRYVFFTPDEYEEYREVLRKIARSLKAGIGIKVPSGDVHPGGEIFPTNTVPVIPSVNSVEDLPDESFDPAKLMVWGFPLNQKSSQKIINARSETLESKFMFRRCLESKRCIVPAKGFFEWKTQEKKKIKTYIRIPGQEAMYIAGLYDEFELPGKGKVFCYTIITTQASHQVSLIHDRMPAILEERHLGLWLNDQIFARYRSHMNKILLPYEGQLEFIPAQAG